MSVLTVYRSELHGGITLPVSKSEAHRAVICSSLAVMRQDSISLGNTESLADDIIITRSAMRDLMSGRREIYCGESGSTLRFLVPLAAALGRSVVFTGCGRLPERPLREYAKAFEGKGTELRFPDRASLFLPLEINGRLQPGVFEMPGNVSSQYISGLLMALPLLAGDSRIVLTSSLESSGYVDITIEVMRRFGVRVIRSGNVFDVKGSQKYSDIEYIVEGDYSAAAFWITANYLGSDVTLKGLSEDSLQVDRNIIELIRNFSDLRDAKRSGSTNCPSPVISIDVSEIPDLVPAISVAAAATDAVTIISNASRLRLKESDRIVSTAQLIRSIGGTAEETSDGLKITGHDGLFRGGHADPFRDHRIAMAAAVAGTYSLNGVSISGYNCVAKSYPDFFEDLIKAGGVVNGFSDRRQP